MSVTVLIRNRKDVIVKLKFLLYLHIFPLLIFPIGQVIQCVICFSSQFPTLSCNFPSFLQQIYLSSLLFLVLTFTFSIFSIFSPANQLSHPLLFLTGLFIPYLGSIYQLSVFLFIITCACRQNKLGTRADDNKEITNYQKKKLNSSLELNIHQ